MMTAEIRKLTLVRFGKFKNFEIDFDSGLNVIYGANEAGKSTINLFIKAMLYGLPTRKKSGEKIKERERAVPRDEKNAEGILTIGLDGRTIEIRRRFGKTAAGDKLEVCDAVSGEKIDGGGDETIGEWLFGIPQTVFEKTLWISQDGAFMGGRDDEILKRIVNLKEGGDEGVSAKEAVERLTALQRQLKAKDGRSTPGRLDVLNNRLEECRREKYDLATRLSQGEASRVRKQNAETELNQTERELEKLETAYKDSLEYERAASNRERYRQICECDSKLELIRKDERYLKSRGLTEEVIAKAQTASERISALEKEIEYGASDYSHISEYEKKKLYAGMISGGGVGIFVLGLVMAVIFTAVLGSAALLAMAVLVAAVGAVTTLLGIRKIKICNNLKRSLENKKSAEDTARKEAESEILTLKADLGELFGRYNAADVFELRSLYLAGQGLAEREAGLKTMKGELLKGYDIEKLKAEAEKLYDRDTEPSEAIAERLNEARKRQLTLVSEIKSLESKMAYEVSEHRIPADIDTEINAIKAEIKACERQLLVIETAILAVNQAAEEWNSMITPEVNKSVNEIMSRLTDGKYNEIRVSDEFAMRVVTENELWDAEYFSHGTYEQLYFALRLALSGFTEGGKPLFLDDILTMYDDDRAEAALRFLKEFEKGGQVFLFTCHKFTREIAEKCRAHIINI